MRGLVDEPEGRERLALLHMDSMGGGSSDSEGSDAERGKLYDPGPQVMSLLKPVSLTMALVIWLVGSLGTEDIKVSRRPRASPLPGRDASTHA